MNSGKKTIHIVEDPVPLQIHNSMNTRVNSVKRKYNSVVIRNGNICGTTFVPPNQKDMTSLTNEYPQIIGGGPDHYISSFGEILEPNKQFSSTTIVNGTDSEINSGITTVHIPVFGLESAASEIDIPQSETSLTLPMKLEMPVETILSENDEIQTFHIEEYTGDILQNPHLQQSLVIATTDAQGNCFLTLEENQDFSTGNWQKINKTVLSQSSQSLHNRWSQPKPVSDVPAVKKVVNSYPIGTRSFIRCGRSRMIADHFTSIPVAEFKSQLNDTSDIIGPLDLAPATKRLMNHLQWKGIGKLFASPGQKIMSTKLTNMFCRHLKTHLVPTEETFNDMKLLPIGYKPEVDPSKIKRITRRRRYPEAEEYKRKVQEQMQQSFQTFAPESHSQIETVFLDNSVSFKEENQDNLQVLVQAAETGPFLHGEPGRDSTIYNSEDINDNSIIVIHNEQQANEGMAFTQQNLDVLLAAAAESGISGDSIHQVIICQSDNTSETVLPGTSSIFIVPNDPLVDPLSEAVITSQIDDKRY